MFKLVILVKKSINSFVRNIFNNIRRKFIKDPIVRKKLSVLYHNTCATCDCKKEYSSELFNYTRIIKGKRNFYSNDIYYGNSFYGHSSILKQYSKYSGKINACIEHGLYLGDWFIPDEVFDSGMKGLITFSDKRLEHLKHVANVPIITIGPYIHYAEPMLTDNEIRQIKQKNGRTLLVFPTHSIDRVDTEFDFKSFNSEIQHIVNIENINHVMICLFYKDVNIGRDKDYLTQGYQVVCSGYRCDPMFLRRLKTFILLSDYTMSNDVGTNVGYCVHLGKPHYVYDQDLLYKPYIKKDMENIIQSEEVTRETKDIKSLFAKQVSFITSEQKEICNLYWGIEHVKTKKELFKIFQGLE